MLDTTLVGRYVDTMLQMIAVAGDNIGDPVWFRVVQIVTDDEPDLQRYAALKMYVAAWAGWLGWQ